MNRPPLIFKHWFIVSTAILGIAIGCWGGWAFSNVRWSPLYEQQIPKPNAKAQFEFWSDSGVFEIKINLPMSAADMSETGGLADKPPVLCKLGFRVRDGERAVSDVDVTSLRWTGINGYAHMNTFSGGAINIPKLGKYNLEITNAGGNFKFPSANFGLERQENAENAAFLSGISKILCYALLGASIVAAAGSWIRYLMTRNKPPALAKTQ